MRLWWILLCTSFLLANCAEYSVTIYTPEEDEGGSGSADTFYYTFIGTEGETEEFQARGERELGETQTWTFEDDTYIGAFECLKIRGKKTHGLWFIKSANFDGWDFKWVNVTIDGIKQPPIWFGGSLDSEDPIKLCLKPEEVSRKGEPGPDEMCSIYCGKYDNPFAEPGAKGEQGPPGEQGPTGEQGRSGTSGRRGEPGEDGPDGPMGEKGEDGQKGRRGVKDCHPGGCKLELGRCYTSSSPALSVTCRVGFAAVAVWRNSAFWSLKCCKIVSTQ